MIIGSHDVFVDVRQWYAILAILEQQVCRIEVTDDGNPYFSTGFLVGSDIVMTSYHNLQNIPQSQQKNIIFRFDYVVLPDGKEVNRGTEFRLADKKWLLNYSSSEETENPELSQLDYALIKVQGEPGMQSVGYNNSYRGWIELPKCLDNIEIEGPLSILPHCNGFWGGKKN